MTTSLKIGIDCGGVLCSSSTFDNNQNNEINTGINIDGAFESITELKNQGHELFLISFCGRHRAEETRHILNESAPNIFKELYFVNKKTNKIHVINYLGCDVMIDDRIELLEYIQRNTNCKNLIWFVGDPNLEEDCRNKRLPDGIVIAQNWKEVLEICSKIVYSENQPNPTINLTPYVNVRTYKYN